NALIAFAIARLAAALAGLITVVVRIKLPALRRGAPAPETFRVQLPLAIALWTASLRSLDTVLVSVVAGLGASGIYAAVSKAVSPFWLIPAAVNPVLTPSVVEYEASRAR